MIILIPDGSGSSPFYRSVVAAIESLGREHTVFLASTSPHLRRLQCLFRPRRCRDVLPVANPTREPLAFVRDIRRHHRERGFDLVLPFSDQTANACCYYRSELSVPLPLPEYATFVQALDKKLSLDAANQVEIPTPRSTCSENTEEIMEWMRRYNLSFPVVVKPRIKGGRGGTALVQCERDLRSTISQFRAIGNMEPFRRYRDPLIQERVAGDIHDCCVLCENGRVTAMLTQSRNRMLGAYGGVGVVNETTDILEVKQQTDKLLTSLHWHGPAQVEWIHDRRDGSFKLLEINPRFWGTTELSMDAGIDFPYLTVRMIQGLLPLEPLTYAVGVRHRWAFPEEFISVMLDKGRRIERLAEYLDIRDLFDPRIRFTMKLNDPLPHLLRTGEGCWQVATLLAKYARGKLEFASLFSETRT